MNRSARTFISLRTCRFALLILALLLLLFPALSVTGKSGTVNVDLTEAERAWLMAHPVIRLAPDPEFKPIEFFD